MIPLYSLMIATEPLSAEVWDEIGLSRRETFADLRHMRIYGQRTDDDRSPSAAAAPPTTSAHEYDRSSTATTVSTTCCARSSWTCSRRSPARP